MITFHHESCTYKMTYKCHKILSEQSVLKLTVHKKVHLNFKYLNYSRVLGFLLSKILLTSKNKVSGIRR